MKRYLTVIFYYNLIEITHCLGSGWKSASLAPSVETRLRSKQNITGSDAQIAETYFLQMFGTKVSLLLGLLQAGQQCCPLEGSHSTSGWRTWEGSLMILLASDRQSSNPKPYL